MSDNKIIIKTNNASELLNNLLSSSDKNNYITIIDDVDENNSILMKKEFLFGRQMFMLTIFKTHNYRCFYCGEECGNAEMYCNEDCKRRFKLMYK